MIKGSYNTRIIEKITKLNDIITKNMQIVLRYFKKCFNFVDSILKSVLIS